MNHRYFSEEPIRGDRVRLHGAEAHHLLHVMRGRKGDEVTLFDGSGAEFPARVVQPGRSEVELEVLAREETSRELPRPATLGVPLPKGDRQRWLVEKLVELGTTRMVPLRAERSVAVPTVKSIRRLRRSVIEASKQCGRNRLMEIAPPQTVAQFVAAAGGERWIADPSEQAFPLGQFLQSPPAAPLHALVGPEGGFTPEERESAIERGFIPVRLAERILRTETAAFVIASAACLRAALEFE